MMEKSSRFSLRLQAAALPSTIPAPGENVRGSQKLEDEIRKSKLREVKRMKEQLEQKLVTLSQNEEFLAGSPLAVSSIGKDPATSKPEMSREERREEDEQKQKEAAELVKRLKEEEKARKKREEERQRTIEEQLRLDEERSKKQKEETEEMQRRKKDEAKQRYQQLRQKREEEHRRFQTLKATSVPRENECLHKKLEEQFQKQVMLPILEEKKQELAKKRNMFKPINREELEEHKRKYMLIAGEKEEQRKEEARKMRKQEERLLNAINKFQTPALERTSEAEQKAREEREQRQNERKVLHEKMEKYASLIKETTRVTVSDEKATELKAKIARLKQPVRQTRDTRKLYEVSSVMKRESLSVAHSASAEQLGAEEASGKMKNQASGPEQQKKRFKKVKTALKMATAKDAVVVMQPEKRPPLDYLGELRRKRAENYNASKSIRYNWKNDLKNKKMTTAEKYSMLVDKANMIEQDAKMNEKLLNVKGGSGKNPEMGEYVSDMFIDAIKAKLAVLEQL